MDIHTATGGRTSADLIYLRRHLLDGKTAADNIGVVDETNNAPLVALWAAACDGDRVAVEHLIAEGVDVNEWDRYGRCALAWAAGRGDLKMMRTLIAAGARVDPFDDYSTFMSPLMAAAEGGQLEAVEMLLEQGANPTLFGGAAGLKAEGHARIAKSDPQVGLIAAVLRRAEDEWHRKHPRA